MRMEKLIFDLSYFLTRLIPNAALRDKIRRTKLYDYRNKMNALRTVYRWRKIRMIRGGWNIGFIVDNKYVFKIRKNFQSDDTKIIREKRITDAFAPVVNVKIPQIKIINAGGYQFHRYNFIRGRNLNTFSARTIRKYSKQLGRDIGEFIWRMHGANPSEIRDLIDAAGDGWNHNDICNNIIVNPKTMRVAAIIDWEYAAWGTLEHEFYCVVAYKKKIRDSKILDAVKYEYHRRNAASKSSSVGTRSIKKSGLN